MPDGAAATLVNGTVVHVGHRVLREGARVALLHVPGLLRFDVERREDTFSFAVRDLHGGTQGDGAPMEADTHVRPDDGAKVNRYRFGVNWEGGPDVDVVVWLPPYDGALSYRCSAFAVIAAP